MISRESAHRSLALDSFLKHTTKKEGGGRKYLTSWKKRTPPVLNFVLHPKSQISVCWQHRIPTVFKDSRGLGDDAKVFSKSWVCHESEDVLINQSYRERVTEKRINPPVLCPMCKLLEVLRALYIEGKLPLTTEVFRWEEGLHPLSMTLGGMINRYGSQKLTDEEKLQIRRARINVSESWLENCTARCNYIFSIVDYDDPSSGVQIVEEGTSLGDVTKKCIIQQIESKGVEIGNPAVNPYVIRWQHDPKATKTWERYSAFVVEKLKITDEIRELLDEDPPSNETLLQPGDSKSLWTNLESHCVLDDPSVIPWEEIFESELVNDQSEEPSAGSRGEIFSTDQTPVVRKSLKSVLTKAVVSEPKIPLVPCVKCGANIPEDATICSFCGAEYEVTEESGIDGYITNELDIDDLDSSEEKKEESVVKRPVRGKRVPF